MAKVARARFVCQACGRVEPKWLGRCAECGAWNSLVEERARVSPKKGGGRNTFKLREVEAIAYAVRPTGRRWTAPAGASSASTGTPGASATRDGTARTSSAWRAR